MTEQEIKNRVETLIALCTVNKVPNVPVVFYSAFIDGKLYRNLKGKTVWNRKCDVINSLKHNSELFKYLELVFEDKCRENNPTWFYRPYTWSDRLWAVSKHSKDVRTYVETEIQAWWNEHVEIKEVLQ